MGMNPRGFHMDEGNKLTFHAQQLVCSQSSSEPHPSGQWHEQGPVDWNIDPQHSTGPLETESAFELDQTSVIMNNCVKIGHSMSYEDNIYRNFKDQKPSLTSYRLIVSTEFVYYSRMHNIHWLRVWTTPWLVLSTLYIWVYIKYLRISDGNSSLNESILCISNTDSGDHKLSILH